MNNFKNIQTKFTGYPTILKCIAYLRLFNQKNPKLFKLIIILSSSLLIYKIGKVLGECFFYINV